MRSAAGIGLIVVGSGVGLLTALVLRTRLFSAGVLVLLASSGMAVGAGALLVQRDPGVPDWVVTLASLAVLVPVHARAMLGHLGRVDARGDPG